jgi:hypothetical protein
MRILVNSDEIHESMPPVYRLDYLAIDETEFPYVGTGVIDDEKIGVAFRGDDRDPATIFKEGFQRPLKSHPCHAGNRELTAKCQKIINTSYNPSLTQIFADLPKEDRLYQLIEDLRTEPFTLKLSEVIFRVRDFDLTPATCVSLTADFVMTSQFPYTLDPKAKEKSNTRDVYIYVIDLSDIRWLPTFVIQQGSPREGLHTSREITCLEVPPENIAGAVYIRRTKSGRSAACTVDFEVLDFISMAYEMDAVGLINFIHDRTGLKLQERSKYRYEGGAIGGPSLRLPSEALDAGIRWVKSQINMHGTISGEEEKGQAKFRGSALRGKMPPPHALEAEEKKPAFGQQTSASSLSSRPKKKPAFGQQTSASSLSSRPKGKPSGPSRQRQPTPSPKPSFGPKPPSQDRRRSSGAVAESKQRRQSRSDRFSLLRHRDFTVDELPPAPKKPMPKKPKFRTLKPKKD